MYDKKESIFLYIYIRKNDKKSVFKGHRMLKNGPNELKFGPDMYFNGFYWFSKEFLEIF